jgi:hypothetical protein
MAIRFVIESSKDAGCELSEDEHLQYCKLVCEAVSKAYDGAECECEPADVARTKVRVYGTNGSFENEMCEDVWRITQDVWEDGEFWD